MDLGAKTRAGFPGPGQYTLPVGVGKQAVSTKRSTRMVGFPTADRDASSKVNGSILRSLHQPGVSL